MTYRHNGGMSSTNPALDPVGKIAELKYCAVDVRSTEAVI